MLNEDKIKGLAEKIDHKALAGAVGLMCMSWLALPIVYWLIVRKKNGEKIDNTSKELQKVRGESKETEKK
jgi:hypothetical protein